MLVDKVKREKNTQRVTSQTFLSTHFKVMASQYPTVPHSREFDREQILHLPCYGHAPQVQSISVERSNIHRIPAWMHPDDLCAAVNSIAPAIFDDLVHTEPGALSAKRA